MTASNVHEDEIDLRELFFIIWKKRFFIIIFTALVTIGSIIYAYNKTPIYEVKSNVQVGYIGHELLVEPKVLERTLNIVFNVEHKNKKDKNFISDVESINLNKKLEDFIQVTTIGISNDEAISKNKEVIEYIENAYMKKIDRFITNRNIEIENTKKQIEYLKGFQTQQLKQQIKKVKEQSIKDIDKRISFLRTKEIVTLDNKIKINQVNLNNYLKSTNEITKNLDNKDSSTKLVASVQLLNYQNLILDAKNEIEDLKLEKHNILDFQILKLEQEKENIINEELKKLEYKLNVEFKNKEESYKNKIKQLEYSISSLNIVNSRMIGEYEFNNYPVKPKRMLIVLVSFMSAFLLSIFIVFFLNFINQFKENKEI